MKEYSWRCSLLLGFIILSVCFHHGTCRVVKVKYPQELINLFKSGTTVNDTVQLVSDIDFSASTHTLPFGAFSNGTCVAFSGVFQGNGHSIKGFVMNNRYKTGYNNAGLFCSLVNATVENLVIDSSCSFTGYNAGALSVTVTGSLTVKHTTSNAFVNGRYRVGGFIGYVEYLKQPTVVSFEHCANHGDVVGSNDHVGGLVGDISYNNNMVLTISNSINNGKIIGRDEVGGLVGSIKYNTNKALTIDNSINNGIVTAQWSAGGLIGNMNDDKNTEIVIDSSHNNGFVIGYDSGGFVGATSGNTNMTITISNSINNEEITANSYVGGFIGYIVSSSSSLHTSVNIINSANKGSVSSKEGKACGFVCAYSKYNMEVKITIKNSINKGSVNAGTYAYGFANNTVARNVVSMGDVTGLSGSFTFWNASTDAGLFYGLNGKCINCSDDATLFQHNTNTGFYEVVGSGEHVDDLLNQEEVSQHFCMMWTKELELVHSGREECKPLSAAMIHALSPVAFIVIMALFIGF